MDDFKQEWSRTQLHWDDRQVIQSRKVPKSLIFNWRKMTDMLRSLCIDKCVSRGNKLLMVDVGCGAGKFYEGLESAFDLYIGIDPSDRMLPGASGNRERFFIRGAGECLPLQSGIADIVLLKSMLDQCYAPRRVISESYRALKDDGWLLISLSNRNSYYALFRDLYAHLRRHKSRHFFQDSHQFYFGAVDVSAMLRERQFEIAHQIPIGYFAFPYCLQWLLPDRVMLRLINTADRLGAAVLPDRGGAFIFVARKNGR